jgi:hypothetical protein
VSGKGKLLIIFFIAVVMLSAYGVMHLFMLRFENGDVFPPYSSLRSDPLGCKALFMALDHSAGLDARRNFRDLERLKGFQGGTIYYLGAGEELLNAPSDERARKLDALAVEGNRLVIAFGRVNERPAAAGKKEDKAEDESAPDKSPKSSVAGQSCASHVGSWGLEIASLQPPVGNVKSPLRASLSSPASELPISLPLHSPNYFKGDGKGWRPVYSYGERAVVLERAVGKGSIVLLADSYFTSNEALRNDRYPGFLAWLQSDGRTALFDESHLGVHDNPGVMALIIKHRLVPFMMALVALAGLYIWKSAIPLVPVPCQETDRYGAASRDNFSGLVNLLRRSVAPGNLMSVCLREWSKTYSREIRQTPELAGQVQTIMDDLEKKPAEKPDPVGIYRKMSGLLSDFRMR